MNTCKVSNGLQLVITLSISWAWFASVPTDKQQVTILKLFRGLIINVISCQCYTLGNVVLLTNALHALIILLKSYLQKRNPINLFDFAGNS